MVMTLAIVKPDINAVECAIIKRKECFTLVFVRRVEAESTKPEKSVNITDVEYRNHALFILFDENEVEVIFFKYAVAVQFIVPCIMTF